MDESHSDINAAFGPVRSVSSPFGDHPLLSSLLEIKHDLSNEVRALTQRMTRIDEQISQIFNFLSPLNAPVANNNSQRISNTNQPTSIPTQSTSLLPPPSSNISTASPESKPTNHDIPQIFETPSFYSDTNPQLSSFDTNQPASPTADAHEERSLQSIADNSAFPILQDSQFNDYRSIPYPIPPPPSIYNRSASSSIISLGISTTPRSSASNKIMPAPISTSSSSPKHPLNTNFRPISNTRFNPGHSPKPKARSHQNRSHAKHQEQTQKSTIIDLESVVQNDTTNKTVPLLSTLSAATTKSTSKGFRRFMHSSSSNAEKSTTSSSTLLYPPTSDDERPMSPTSSGNDDDDHRPLTSSSYKYHHQTLL